MAAKAGFPIVGGKVGGGGSLFLISSQKISIKRNKKTFFIYRFREMVQDRFQEGGRGTSVRAGHARRVLGKCRIANGEMFESGADVNFPKEKEEM